MVRREVRSLAPVLLLDPARSTFDEMLRGYAVSMRSRGLAEGTIRVSQYGVKRFFHFAGTYPWQWRPSRASARPRTDASPSVST